MTQIRGISDELSITLPAFWTSLTFILEQLIADLIARYDRKIGNLRSIAYSIESIIDYSLFSLSGHLSCAVFVSIARSNGYEDIARFMDQFDQDDLDFISTRLSRDYSANLSREDLEKIDLVGKENILHASVYVPLRLFSDIDYLEFRVGVPVEVSIIGFHWYDVYLPHIIGTHILVWSLRRGIRSQNTLLRGKNTRVGLHMEDYKKSGIA